MAKLMHSTLSGRLTLDPERGYLIDGFDLNDVFQSMIDGFLTDEEIAAGVLSGPYVQFELVGYSDKKPEQQQPTSEAPGTDFIQKLMGDGPAG